MHNRKCVLFWVLELVSGSSLLPYSGKLLRKKVFMNFVVLWLFVKVFILFTNSRKFSPTKVSCCTVFNYTPFSTAIRTQSGPEFCGFVVICECFLCEIWECSIHLGSKSEQSTNVFSLYLSKVFSLKSFPLLAIGTQFPTISHF